MAEWTEPYAAPTVGRAVAVRGGAAPTAAPRGSTVEWAAQWAGQPTQASGSAAWIVAAIFRALPP